MGRPLSDSLRPWSCTSAPLSSRPRSRGEAPLAAVSDWHADIMTAIARTVGQSVDWSQAKEANHDR